MSGEPPRWEPPVPPGPPVTPPPASAPEKPVYRPPPPGPQAEPPPPALPLAGWGARAAAYLLDTLVMVGLAAIAFFLAWAISGAAGRAGIIAAIAYGGCEYFVRGVIYAPLLMSRAGERNGQTLGKQLVGIRVVRESAQPMDYGHALVRQWLVITLLIQVVGGAFTGGISWLIDVLWPLWDSRNRAVHDIIASTMVFKAG